MSASIEDAIFHMLGEASGRSVSAEQVARAAGGEAWRAALGQVRATAVGLARQGKLDILRHGKPVDPNAFKGVYRLRLPQAADVDNAADRT